MNSTINEDNKTATCNGINYLKLLFDPVETAKLSRDKYLTSFRSRFICLMRIKGKSVQGDAFII